MRQTPPVARCASHPPKRAERRCGAGAVADATGGRAPPKVRHEPVAAVQRQPLGRWPVPGSRVGVSLVWASVLRLFVAAGGRLRRALVSRRCTLDSLLGGNTSKGSTCDAADDRPWRTTDDRACHFARDGARNSATKRSFAVRRPSIRFRALWACHCRLLGFRARDARASVHDRSLRRRRSAGAPPRGSVSSAWSRRPGVWAARQSFPREDRVCSRLPPLPRGIGHEEPEGFNNPNHAAQRYSWIRPPSTSLRSTGVRGVPRTCRVRLPAGTAKRSPRCGHRAG